MWVHVPAYQGAAQPAALMVFNDGWWYLDPAGEVLDPYPALAEAGYDLRLVLGDGGHSPNHGGVLLPDALRWTLTRPT